MATKRMKLMSTIQGRILNFVQEAGQIDLQESKAENIDLKIVLAELECRLRQDCLCNEVFAH
jgi:hypothetical protein